ncbi:helix-turn-helix transcriptional regulator [Streptomyces sp. PSKA54]|uniref:Helix-turn-helix transcriptional regulator n=1 Tax=Streptomyces himalayensis subsp. aureolus TaxID=2758039 RepID=A0A7W2D7E0_9ACTN|nr:helix-turn-helix transcriptional regulator [Streptomyces himalayensis]MBA4865897.1 helix-turn-helix transcriptional regulator [Streptomyces himalayensis subsp. aureolus]
MSTDFQQARVSLGARLRELRAGITGRDLAARLGWPQSKVSKLETGRQTATAADLTAWAEATGHPEAAEELTARLQGMESHVRSWRRQLRAGHRPVQDALTVEYERSTVLRAWEGSMVVGMLQTPDYARHIFTRYAELHGTKRDIDDAVRARVRRQDLLYQPGRTFHIVMWEAALHAGVCPPNVLAAQLDRLGGVIGLDTVKLGIVPFGAPVNIPPANGFWLYDERLAIVEDWHAELWLDDTDSLRVYRRVWDTLNQSAVYGSHAHRLIARARAHLD